jgi:hypothetical protein
MPEKSACEPSRRLAPTKAMPIQTSLYNECLFPCTDAGKSCLQLPLLTSNKQPSLWSEFFESMDDLATALDGAFDEAVIINFKGTSYRGQQREIVSVGAGEAEPIQN